MYILNAMNVSIDEMLVNYWWWLIEMQLHGIVLYYDSHESVKYEECEDVWLWDGQAEPGI